MAPLPSSLSPHICVLPSPDLTEFLESSSLPPLPHILQSFSPFPQVTTRTTSFTSIPHSCFYLRFSDLRETEIDCQEDEEQRAVRTIDWISTRINKRCTKWVEEIDQLGDEENLRTPWWDEVKKCVEGDYVPSKTEGWNHPVAVILAVSTTAPNPLQAITALHSRNLEFPSWVDPVFLRYTLIVHPENSPLSDEEAGALFNAVKKQFGLHSYLLPLVLPTPPPPPVPVPNPIPRLPPPPQPETFNSYHSTPTNLGASPPSGVSTLAMTENDIQQTARFTREFLVMSLIPWMEKCVVEWNENFSSTRRLPSRLFSSTRRLFGSSSPSPAPIHSPSSSTVSLPSRAAHNTSMTANGAASAPPLQQRRLAEFATMLGDLKLATTVWESLRKESRGGSDILPLLLSPSLALPLHASNALSAVHLFQSSDPPARAQLRALTYAVRWETGIEHTKFFGNVLEGERWLVWAAGNIEETPSALLLAHAALLSSKKQARRRAALWYLSAANRLEKCGVRSLTMYFLRKAHDLYKNRPQKIISTSFWESEGMSPLDARGIDAIIMGIEHPLGRLSYTTGDVSGAVRFFLGLLRGSHESFSHLRPLLPSTGIIEETANMPGADKVYLDDFRVAFTHLKSTSGDHFQLKELKLPFTFCDAKQTRVRLPRDNEPELYQMWERREETWRAFWKARGGNEVLSRSGQASADETFWIDLVLRNPLDAEVNLSNVTVILQEASAQDPSFANSFVEVESIDNVVLSPRESRTVPICIKSQQPASLMVTHATYDFLSLLPSTESLSSRGRRLHDTLSQRQRPTYSPDVVANVVVEEPDHKLLANFVDDDRLVLAQGETKTMSLWFSNTGMRPVDELWLVCGPEDEIYISAEEDSNDAGTTMREELLQTVYSLHTEETLRVPLPHSDGSRTLHPGDNFELSLTLHAESVGEQNLCLLFVYRGNGSKFFKAARLYRHFSVYPLLEATVTVQPCQSLEHLFLLNLELWNRSPSTVLNLTQVTCLSPTWKCSSIATTALGSVPASQSSRLIFGANRWEAYSEPQEIIDFVSKKIDHVLHGRPVDISIPPPVTLLGSHLTEADRSRSVGDPITRRLLHGGKRNAVIRTLSRAHPHIPSDLYPFIFPLYNPASVDIVIFWSVPSEQRSGHICITGITLGASHAALKEAIDTVEGAKVKRSMFAETQREKAEILNGIRESEWNTEMNPMVLSLQETGTLLHNFTQGPYCTSVSLTLRNYSLTHTCQFLLRLPTGNTSPSKTVFPLHYTGRLTFRGTLKPLEATTIHARVCIIHPGEYGLGGWNLETQVLEPSRTASGGGNVRHRYYQESSPDDRTCLIVRDEVRRPR